jgi:thiosulfate reductase cytochrome b subunit
MSDAPKPESAPDAQPPVAPREAEPAAPPAEEAASRTGDPGEQSPAGPGPLAHDEAEPAVPLPAGSTSPPVSPPVSTARRPLVKRHHGIVRAAHWLNTLLLAGMIASGLQIYSAFRHFGPRGGPYWPNPWDDKVFPQWSRLGGWLAGGLNWHFALAWPFVLTGVAYLAYMVLSGEWRTILFRPRDVPRVMQMQLYYLRLRRDHPPQGKHNALQKGAYSFIFLLGVLSVASGFAIYKPVQLSWLVTLFGGYELARFWHFWFVFVFIAFTLLHVALVLLVDPASLRAMITGWYRGRFPSHD